MTRNGANPCRPVITTPFGAGKDDVAAPGEVGVTGAEQAATLQSNAPMNAMQRAKVRICFSNSYSKAAGQIQSP
jgi:hypothetical protein